jgi:hypothetical protein
LGVAASCRHRCPFACSFTDAASWRSSACAFASMWRVASGSKQRRKPPRERRRRLDQSRVHRRRSLGGARAPIRWRRATRLVRRCGDPCGRSYARSLDAGAGSGSRPMAELPSNRFDGAHGGVISRRPSEHSSEHFPRRHGYPERRHDWRKACGYRRFSPYGYRSQPFQPAVQAGSRRFEPVTAHREIPCKIVGSGLPSST